MINFLNSINRADEYINNLLFISRDTFLVKIFTGITWLGEIPTIIILILATSVILYLSNKKWQIIGLWGAVAGSAGTTLLAKIFFDRLRPLNGLISETSASFPSGHATVAVAFYGFITYLLLKKIHNKINRVLAALLGSIIIIAIGFSRLYLGVHYATDVLAGYLIGSLWLLIGIKLNKEFFTT